VHDLRHTHAEIPPRARGRGTRAYMNRLTEGNTPACAGKSHRLPILIHRDRKYPRVRGEEHRGQHERELAWEIPPRARGRGVLQPGIKFDNGNTPACAGKSDADDDFRAAAGKYPRVRGEEAASSCCSVACWEIPPRARGREKDDRSSRFAPGNTPACAGKSVA